MKNEIKFNPKEVNLLNKNKWYKSLLVLPVMLILVVMLFTQCKDDDFEGVKIGVCPEVVSVDPADGETGVPTYKTISVSFNENMNPETIHDGTFLLYQDTTQISGNVTAKDSGATFEPSTPLDVNTLYTATITTDVRDTNGNYMIEDFVWSFTTGENPDEPEVISTDPQNSATNVPLDKTVSATFNEMMDPATITDATFTLSEGTNSITGTVSYSGITASLNPDNDLEQNKTYTATITTGAENTSGTGLANDYVWTFSTGATVASPEVTSTDPANNANNTSLNKVVTATFNQVMNPATITDVTFTIQEGANSISGTVSYTGTTASFVPDNNLDPGQTYTATITTGAQNAAGVGLASDYVWTFSTSTPPPVPMVDLKSVAAFGIIAGTGVSNNAGFSEIRNMDVGISPGVRSSVTGFPPAIVVNGDIYASDDIAPPGVPAMLTQAKQDLEDAYLFAEGATTPAPAIVSGDIGGTTLAPGIYKSTSTLLLQSGDLTLDAQGDPNATWIFQVASDFTTVGGAGGNVILSGGAQAGNIFWQVGSSATIGDDTSFKGNILALTSITMNSGAVAEGRMLAINGAVVMTNTNIINRP